MTVYMLRNNETGLYYRRMKGYAKRWVEQEKASVWTLKIGPTSARSRVLERRPQLQDDLEIVPFILKETTP